jgi:4-hydroxybenzoate polyprenyltransferase
MGEHILWSLLRGSRLIKVAPLLLLVVCGALVGGHQPSLPALAVALAFCFLALLLTTQLNVLTDRQLDRARKPELFASLAADPRALAWLLVVELAAMAALLLAALLLHVPMLAGVLALVGAASNLYSYNYFVPMRGGALRWKTHWLGHAVTIWGTYAGLWLAGYLCSRTGSDVFDKWLPVFLCAGMVDYAVFLNEAAADADEERAAGLHTLPALLGRARTSLVAAGLWGLSLLVLVPLLARLPGDRRSTVSAALLASTVLQGVACALAYRAAVKPQAQRIDPLVDAAFWSARVVAALILILPLVLS